jgi:hypothetical protein
MVTKVPYLSYEYSHVIDEPPSEEILKLTVDVVVLPLELHEIPPPIFESEGAAAFAAGIL